MLRDIVRQYSVIAQRYRSSTKRVFNKPYYKRIISELVGFNSVGTVLDVGCGEGTYTSFLKDEFTKDGTVIGIDISKEMIDLAKADYPGIDFRLESMDDISLKDETVDFVFSRYAIHYSENLEKTLVEIARITKPGGTFVIKDVHPFYTTFLKPSLDYEKKEDVVFNVQHDDSISVIHPSFTFEEYMNAFTVSGWKLKSIREMYGVEALSPKTAPYRVATSVYFVLVKE